VKVKLAKSGNDYLQSLICSTMSMCAVRLHNSVMGCVIWEQCNVNGPKE
jgi:hypothetical protein